jgi:hypothetical protein
MSYREFSEPSASLGPGLEIGSFRETFLIHLDPESRRAFELFGTILGGFALERALREEEPFHLTALQVLGAIEDLRHVVSFLEHLARTHQEGDLPPGEARLLVAVRKAAQAVESARCGLEAAVEKTLA